MSKKQIQNDRIEKNLKVLKLLSKNDSDISEEQKREVLKPIAGGADYVMQSLLRQFIGD